LGDGGCKIVFSGNHFFMDKILLTLSLLLPLACFGQDYQPFQPDKLHWFTSGSNYSVRIDSVGLIGGDSAFWMNEIAIPPSANCWITHQTHFRPHQEGLFGDHFISGADGAYRFVNRAGDTATIHTRLPDNVAWTFLSDSNLTATISLRGQISVLGQLDSMIVIDISDGEQYRITQHNGIYLGPNLSYYLRSDSMRFSTIAERPTVPDFKDFFAWQPGDVFTKENRNGNTWLHYDRYEILSRTVSTAGDTLILRAKHRHREHWFPTPDTILPPDTIDLIATRATYGFLELATGEPDTNTMGHGYHMQQAWENDPDYFGRKSFIVQSYPYSGMLDTCGYGYQMAFCPDPIMQHYTWGLGATSTPRIIGNTMTTCIYAYVNLVCYAQSGQDSLGPCPPDAAALPVIAPEPEAQLHAWRNAQTAEQGLQWQGLKPDRYTWQVYDLNGRILQNEEIVMDRNGSRTLMLPGSAGMYLVRITAESGAWTQTIMVPMNW
jgi:hypothetical protein